MQQKNLFSFITEIYIIVAFSPIYFLIILAKKLIKFCNLVQFWYVIFSFYSLTVLKIQHT